MFLGFTWCLEVVRSPSKAEADVLPGRYAAQSVVSQSKAGLSVQPGSYLICLLDTVTYSPCHHLQFGLSWVHDFQCSHGWWCLLCPKVKVNYGCAQMPNLASSHCRPCSRSWQVPTASRVTRLQQRGMCRCSAAWASLQVWKRGGEYPCVTEEGVEAVPCRV